MSGPAPKPASLKAYEGNRGRRKLSVGDVRSGPIESPIPLEGLALAEWERIIGDAFWLTEADAGNLADRCICFARMLEAEADIKKRGMTVGRRKSANPSVRFARQYRRDVQRYDNVLGLTAASRDREGAPGGRKHSDDIDLLEAALCGPFGLQQIRIWRELRAGKVEDATTAAERAEWKADLAEADRRLAAWKLSMGIEGDGECAISAPLDSDDFSRYHLEKLEQTRKTETALLRAGLDPRKQY